MYCALKCTIHRMLALISEISTHEYNRPIFDIFKEEVLHRIY